MSELRQNLATKEWYVIATERAKRPHDFVGKNKRPPLPQHDPKCPFCPGNESMTPPTRLAIPSEDAWRVRVVANKFSAFSPEGDRRRRVQNLHRSLAGVGVHDVIIETPRHDLTPALLPLSHVCEIVQAYRARYNAVLEDPRVAMVIPFKNHGAAAGTSLQHSHSQLIGMPLATTHIMYRMEEARRHYNDNGRCVFCTMLEGEASEGTRVVYDNAAFLVFVPYASGAPYETWIIPKRHTPSFGDLTDEEVPALADALRSTLRRYYFGLDDPDFNYVVRSTPSDERDSPALHWYIKLMPKLTKVAGFELGTGMYVNVTLPEEGAKFLRELRVPEDDEPAQPRVASSAK